MRDDNTRNRQQTPNLHGIRLFFIALPLVLLLAACGAPASPATATASSAAVSSNATLKEYTVDELAKFDGQNGNPAYIAVDGNVYDVTNAAPWANGSHFGQYTAGKDLSKAILLVSHGKAKLSEVPMIGTLK